MKINNKGKKELEDEGYRLTGRNSGVKICRWTKKSLRDEGECYKQQFYGINSGRCCQMSCCLLSCQNKCIHCWRNLNYTSPEEGGKPDEPIEMIENCIKEQRKLISGFKGSEKTNLKKWKEAQNPNQFAISLSGEPTIYPKLAELILELRKRKMTSFLVTNGLVPERLLELEKRNALPTQLYVSVNYWNERIFRKFTRNKQKDAWKKLMKTLELVNKIGKKTRTVVRLNLVRDLNMQNEEDYSKLVKIANPMFIELKGYMAVGHARKRLGYERMPLHSEIKQFSQKLLEFLPGYNFLDEKVESRVVLIGKSKKDMIIKKGEI